MNSHFVNSNMLMLDGRERLRHQRPGNDSSFANKLFWTAFGLHVLVIGILMIIGNGSISIFSRDSIEFNRKCMAISQRFSDGIYMWEMWIDDGWYQFSGLVYYLLGPFMLLILLISSALASFACVLCYRLAAISFDDESIGRFSGLLLAWFPSVVYYTSLPLKEGAAIFGILSIVYGVVSHKAKQSRYSIIWIITGLAIMAALRIYLCYVSMICVVICLSPIRMIGGFQGLIRLGIVVGFLVLSGFVAVYSFDIDVSHSDSLKYFDINYINNVRYDMNGGYAKMFKTREEAKLGGDIFKDAMSIGKGLFFFIFSIDATSIKRERQAAALPEMIFFLYCLPYLFKAIWHGWKTIPDKILPIGLFGLVIVAIYSSATTNMGAMYRWRVQALPFLVMLIVYGASVRETGIIYAVLSSIRRKITRRQSLNHQFAQPLPIEWKGHQGA